MWEAVQGVTTALAANGTAWMAAIAALFSAASSFLIWRVQRNNFLESIRPDLELLDWSRVSQGEATPGERAVLVFRAIMNVGRGAAFDTWLHVERDPLGQYQMTSAQRLPTIAINRELPFPGRIIVRFQRTQSKTVVVPLRLSFRDSSGYWYDALVQLNVFRASIPFEGYTIAPNVTMLRKTARISARLMRFRARRNRLLVGMSKLPVLGRLLFP